MRTVDVGIFAHNEGATIRQVVEGFLAQELSSVVVSKLVVVCCGCTDETVPIVREMAGRHTGLQLLVRPRREGKVAAINQFLATVHSDVVVLASGDVVPAPELVELLAAQLPSTGPCMMAGPQVFASTAGNDRTIIDDLHAALWQMHHAVSLRRPKLGEVVALRGDAVAHPLPTVAHCDEALLESIVNERGGITRYVPEAHAYNFAPRGLADLYRQRRRIAAQHRMLFRMRGYRPATSDPWLVLSALTTMPLARWPILALLALLELVARLHGRWDVSQGRSYQIWRVDRPLSRDMPIADGPHRASTTTSSRKRRSHA